MVKRRPEEIKDVILKVMGNLSANRPAGGTDITQAFDKIFTEKERRHIKISGVKEHTLFLHVDSPAWMFQFNLKRQRILKDLQHENPDIHKVYFKIGKAT